MDERKRSTTGEYVETVKPAAVLAALGEHPDPVATAKEVGEALGCTGEAARQKLTQLHDDGRVERKTVGARAVVWWPAGRGLF